MSQPIKSFACTQPELAQYALDCFKPEDSCLAAIRKTAAEEKLPNIHVGAMDGRHLEILVRMSGAKKVIEIGSLAGYSGLCIARALPPDGQLHLIELHEKNARVCRDTFAKNGVSEKTKVHEGEALLRLPELEKNGPFDLIFIDADKSNYPKYLDWAEKHLRIGGTVIADNTFAWGLVLQDRFDTDSQQSDATGIKEFNQRVANSPYWRATILPTGEGLTVAVKIAD
jgi:caffeoyl-CoA O-methyltransferase